MFPEIYDAWIKLGMFQEVKDYKLNSTDYLGEVYEKWKFSTTPPEVYYSVPYVDEL